MALTIGEGNDFNVVLRYLFDQPNATGTKFTSEQARDAAARLADKAAKTLMAGYRGDDVRALWPGLDDQLVAGIDEDAEGDTTLEQADAYLAAHGIEVADHPFQGTERVPGYCKRCGCAPHIHPRAS